jgi:hypothetical protein
LVVALICHNVELTQITGENGTGDVSVVDQDPQELLPDPKMDVNINKNYQKME